MNRLTRKEELRLFRKVCGQRKAVDNKRINRLEGNSIRAGYYNQGVARAKLRDYILYNKIKYSFWSEEEKNVLY